jgi:predicted DNA-binding transcriptional regulator AlpA
MFDKQSFEWVFVVPDISEPDDSRIDDLNRRCDAVVESHGGLSLVSTLTQGHSAVDAARVAIQVLEDSGLSAERTYPDLVTRADIAVRVQKTRQAVDNWVRGDRQQDFPSPVHLAGGGLWLWRDVSEWLQRERIKDLPDDGGAQYPALADHAAIDSQLATQHHRLAYGGMSASRFVFDAAILHASSLEVLISPPRMGKSVDAGFINRLIYNMNASVFKHAVDERQGSGNPREIESRA